MTNRINLENIQRQANYLSELTGMDLRLDGAYGGYRLVKQASNGGHTAITHAYEPKRALSEKMFAMQDMIYAMRSVWAPDHIHYSINGEGTCEPTKWNCPVCNSLKD